MVIKIQNDTFNGNYGVAAKGNKNSDNKSENGCVFGGNINKMMDPVAIKKEQAQKQAMKLWTEAVDVQQKLDTDMDQYAEHMNKLRGLMDESLQQINMISDEQAALQEKYEIQDVAKELAENPEGEFATRYADLEEAKSMYREELADYQDEYVADSNILEGMKNGRLKSHAMVDAQKQKDEMMIAASENAVNGMMEQVKEKLDEDQAEREEKAAEKAEEKEIQEERLEAIREKNGERTEEDEEDFAVAVTEGLIKLDEVKDGVKQEVQKLVNDMNLLEEDLKGAAVDTQL